MQPVSSSVPAEEAAVSVSIDGRLAVMMSTIPGSFSMTSCAEKNTKGNAIFSILIQGHRNTNSV
jgi:hypothetical protein